MEQVNPRHSTSTNNATPDLLSGYRPQDRANPTGWQGGSSPPSLSMADQRQIRPQARPAVIIGAHHTVDSQKIDAPQQDGITGRGQAAVPPARTDQPPPRAP